MTKNLEIYHCNVCGNTVEMVGEGVGTLVCCGQPMEKMAENTSDAAKEKHVPVIEKDTENKKLIVRIGEVAHPMTEDHYIQWVEVITDHSTRRKFLKAADEPMAEFCLPKGEITVRIYCNLHGLWTK